MNSFLKRFSRDQEGAIAAIIVIMLPVLLGFMAARRMAVAEAPYAGTDVTCADVQAQTPGTAENIACSMLPNWGANITVNATELCPADRAVRVQVSANGQDVALADIFGFFNGKTISATVEMRKEAECA